MVQHLKTQWHTKEVTSSDSFALLLGNEGEGVNPELLAHTTQKFNHTYLW